MPVARVTQSHLRAPETRSTGATDQQEDLRMNSRTRITALLVVALAALLSALAAGVATAAHKAGPTVTIWTDQNRKADVQSVAQAWGAARGVTVNVVVKDFGSIRDNLKTVALADAPDVIVGAHDWTG